MNKLPFTPKMASYLYTARMGMRESQYFGLIELIGTHALRLLQLIFMLLLWQTLFKESGQYDGMTEGQMLSYTLCSSALSPLLDIRTKASSWLHDGSMQSLYQRPMGIFGQLVAQSLGGMVMPLVIFVPMCAALGAVMGVTLVPASSAFFLSLTLCVLQGFAIDFMFACLIIRSGNLSYQIDCLRRALNVLLSGALIPFAVLPWGIGDVLALSPLGTLAGAPLSLFAGLGDPHTIIPAQILWNILLWPTVIAAFKHDQERMVSFGG